MGWNPGPLPSDAPPGILCHLGVGPIFRAATFSHTIPDRAMPTIRIPLALPFLALAFIALSACASGGGSANGTGEPVEERSTLETLTLGETWVLRSVRGVEAIPESAVPSIQFLTNGRLTGNTSCNQMNGRYALDGVAVDFAGLATTRMACDGAPGEMEPRFLQTLEAARFLELGPEFLDLFDEDGERVARFSRR